MTTAAPPTWTGPTASTTRAARSGLPCCRVRGVRALGCCPCGCCLGAGATRVVRFVPTCCLVHACVPCALRSGRDAGGLPNRLYSFPLSQYACTGNCDFKVEPLGSISIFFFLHPHRANQALIGLPAPMPSSPTGGCDPKMELRRGSIARNYTWPALIGLPPCLAHPQATATSRWSCCAATWRCAASSKSACAAERSCQVRWR